MSPGKLVPFRWPSAWQKPELLSLLERSPVNCVVFDGGESTGAVRSAARAAGLTVMEWSSLGAVKIGEVKPGPATAPVTLEDLVWPRMKMSAAGRRGDADAGPTGAPWIDSNSWVVKLAAARAPGRPIWLSFDPPADEPAPDEAAYVTAITDSAASGARWMVSLDKSMAEGLQGHDATAMKRWEAITSALRFFEERRRWAEWQPWGPVGIVSSFAGEHEYLGQELLNLSARRNLLYRVIDRAIPASYKLEGLRAVLYADGEPPSPKLKALLGEFVTGGGMLIAPGPVAKQFPAGPAMQCAVAGYAARRLGKGSVTAGMLEWDDPYFLAADVHSLVSRRHDPVRLFNGRSLWLHYSVAPGGTGALLQLVSFTSRGAQSVSLAPSRRWRSAKLHALGSEPPTQIEPVMVEDRAEFQLARVTRYSAVEFES